MRGLLSTEVTLLRKSDLIFNDYLEGTTEVTDYFYTSPFRVQVYSTAVEGQTFSISCYETTKNLKVTAKLLVTTESLTDITSLYSSIPSTYTVKSIDASGYPLFGYRVLGTFTGRTYKPKLDIILPADTYNETVWLLLSSSDVSVDDVLQIKDDYFRVQRIRRQYSVRRFHHIELEALKLKALE